MVLEFTRNDNAGSESLVLAASGDGGILQEFRAAAEAEGCQVIALESASEVASRARSLQPPVILLDAGASDALHEDGIRVLETLKNGSYTAALSVLVLLPPGTDEEAQLALFHRGADDCLARPHGPDLLRARLRAFIRRPRTAPGVSDKLVVGAVGLDLSARKVTVDGSPVALTRKEFDLLNMLLRHRGTVVYTTQLYHTVWGHGGQGSGVPVDAHTVKVHVSSLRGKLGRDLGRKIVNLPGLGYRFDE
jgi:two-component system KDP operon response regulator KdpE